MKYKIQTYDFEVFKDWWCCSFLDEKENYITFQSGQELAIIDYIIKHKSDTVFVGYNNVHFDNWCLKCIWYGVNPWKVVDYVFNKDLKPHLIKELQYKKNIDFMSFDLMKAIGVGAPSLKDIEANMGIAIEFSDSIMTGKDQNLTPDEKEKVIKYNRHDCYATMKLYDKLKGELNSYLVLIDKFNLPISTLTKNKSQIFEVIGAGKFKQQLEPYEYKYTSPSCLELEDKAFKNYCESFTFTKDNEFSYEIMWNGYPINFGRGGIHYAIKNYIKEFDGNTIMLCFDFKSFYTGLMANKKHADLRYIDWIIDWNVFRELGDLKLATKTTDPELSNAIKIPVNAAYGKTIDKYFKYSYWPAGLSICLSGQLIAYMIIERLNKEKIGKLIQANTDGFYMEMKIEDLDRCNKIVKEFQDKLGIDFDVESILHGKICQKDVNNYIIYDKDKDKFKVKGKYVKRYRTKKDYCYCANQIVDEAIVNKLIFDIPTTKTIFDAYQNNLSKKFQLIYNMKGKNYTQCMYGNKEIPKINRGFASNDKKLPAITKVKDCTKCKFPDMPEHVMIYNGDLKDFDVRKMNLDIQWYINLANDGVKKFLGEDE